MNDYKIAFLVWDTQVVSFMCVLLGFSAALAPILKPEVAAGAVISYYVVGSFLTGFGIAGILFAWVYSKKLEIP